MMNIKHIFVGVTLLTNFSLSYATNVNLTGGISGTYLYQKNNGNHQDGQSVFEVTDFILHLDSGETKINEIGFTGAMGTRKGHTILDPEPLGSYRWDGVDFDYAYLIFKPHNKITIELGNIFTTMGYEYSPNYANQEIFRGILWNSQPGSYDGIRMRYLLGNFQFSVEMNQDKSQYGYVGAKRNNWGVSTSGELRRWAYTLTYYQGKNSRDIIDALITTNIGKFNIGLNMDYFMVDDSNNSDNKAYGVAFYASTKLSTMSFPLRIEYVNDGNSQVYTNSNGNVNRAYSITFSPTMHYDKNAYLRFELIYAYSKNKTYVDNSGAAQNNQLIFASQIGMTF